MSIQRIKQPGQWGSSMVIISPKVDENFGPGSILICIVFFWFIMMLLYIWNVVTIVLSIFESHFFKTQMVLALFWALLWEPCSLAHARISRGNNKKKTNNKINHQKKEISRHIQWLGAWSNRPRTCWCTKLYECLQNIQNHSFYIVAESRKIICGPEGDTHTKKKQTKQSIFPHTLSWGLKIELNADIESLLKVTFCITDHKSLINKNSHLSDVSVTVKLYS